jgi:adenine-specific DNA-methyltransferase
MLTSIALWDQPAVGEERGRDGRLLQKAGIRADWTRTRSAFCHAGTAPAAMRETVRAADCRWLVVSYSDEGLIGLEELCDLLAAEGALSLRSTGYVKYPGGKQSMTRTIRNQELALVVDRRASRGAASTRRLLTEVRIARLMSGSFHPARIRTAFAVQGEGIVPSGATTAAIPMRHFWRFSRNAALPVFESEEAADAFRAALTACALGDVREEIEVLVAIAGSERNPSVKEKLLKEILRLLNRLAHRKYRAEFQQVLDGLRSALLAPEGSPFRMGLDAAAEKAERRLAPGAPGSA